MSDVFNSFWHLCPICGNYVDDGAADGRCFDCLEAENDNSVIDFNKSWCACPSCGRYDDSVPAACCFDCFFYLGSAESTEKYNENDNSETSALD